MNKKDVIEKALRVLQAKAGVLKRQINKEDEKRKAAPSAMESWSDNTRFEKEVLISQLTEEKEKLKKHIAFLRALTPLAKEKAQEGSLVEIKNLASGQTGLYFISLFAGLELATKKDKKVIFLSQDSPLTKLLLNKKKGDELKYGRNSDSQTVKVLSIE